MAIAAGRNAATNLTRKRHRSAQDVVGDLLKAEIVGRRRSIRYHMRIAKLLMATEFAECVTVDRCGPVSGHRHSQHRLMSP